MNARDALSFLTAAAEQPERVALVEGGVPHTYADLAPRVATACDQLRVAAQQRVPARVPSSVPSRVPPHVPPRVPPHVPPRVPPHVPPRVPIVAANDLSTVITLYALLELGIPALLIHPRLTPAERARLPLDAPFPPGATPLAVVFTSGTTGTPRGAALPRRAFLAAAAASAANLGWRDDDRWQLAMPLAHVGGMSILTRCLAARRTVVLGEPRDAARDGVTIMSLVPTQLVRLLASGWTPPPAVRAILLGGAAAPASLLARRDLPLVATYGLTEACSQVATQRYGATNYAALRAVEGMQIRIGEGDRILIRGPSLMTGYLGDESPPFVDLDWFDTGDLGALDATGALTIFARRTDLIVTGGENVYPMEVERALEEHPAIVAACVVGVPDPTWGQLVAAAVVTRGPIDDSAIAAHCAARLASFKRPRLLRILPELPVLPSGKPDKRTVLSFF